MSYEINRRTFIKGSVLATAGGAVVFQGSARQAHAQAEANKVADSPGRAATASALPKGKIGKLEISRLILGGNLLTHYTHSRDLKYVYNLAAHYNTDEKIMETLALAEAHGINCVSMHNPPHPMSVLRRYRKERGGKIQWIICPTAEIKPDLADYRRMVEELVKDGCEAIYLWGVRGDALAGGKQFDLMAKVVEMPRKEFGVPSGVGGHKLEVVKACEEHGVNPDFYIKTFHHSSYPSAKMDFDNSWCDSAEEVAAFMGTVTKPWIAFKVMAAGAIPPQNAFRYAFKNGADHVLAGMFDFEVAEDVRIAGEAASAAGNRPRPWRS
jgi:hypothetical protein